jgi:pyruvate/2-oxoglutarate dehydrogenase complex dihydrolipoamide dehydrogenase (E3) component
MGGRWTWRRCGRSTLVAPRTVEVRLAGGGTRRLTGERVFLNLGTRATIPEIPGLAAAAPLTHVEALELGRLPEHLTVLGGATSPWSWRRPSGASAAG